MTKLKYFREIAGYTQEDMAKRLGLTKSGYTLKEQGKRSITVQEAIIISDAIKQPIKKIFA
jgi:DNA-binding XRE family transcriptional regulator